MVTDKGLDNGQRNNVTKAPSLALIVVLGM